MALVVAAWHPSHAEGVGVDPCAGKDGADVDLIDPAIASADKATQLKLMESLASNGCTQAVQLLGSMFRFGPELPGNPLPKDVSRAATLLEQAAVSGDSFAFAELAEMSLAEDMPHQAMQWTQVYLWLVTHNPKLGDVTEYPGYEADLLSRAKRAWKAAHLDFAQIQPMVSAYLTHDRQALIIANLERSRELKRARPRLSLASRPHAPGRVGPHSGYVLFLVEAKPSGEVTRIAVESYAPSKAIVDRLKPMLDGVRLTPFEGTSVRSGVLPVVYNSR